MINSFYRDKRILITGGLGFIGSNLAHRILQLNPRQVLIVDSLSPGCGGNKFNLDGIAERVTVQVGDVCDRKLMSDMVSGVDVVFNLAGKVSHIDSMADPYEDLESNCRSHLTLLEACRSRAPEARIVYTSTRQVYGRPRYLPVDEKHPVCPVDINGVNKLAAEHYHLIYNQVYDMHTVILRLTNTYGPRQLIKHPRQGFIGWFIRRAVDGDEILIYGDGQQRRDLNFVDDVIDAILLAGADERARGQIFNLGTGEPVTLIKLAELLIELAGGGSYRLVPFPEDKRRIDIGSYYSDFSKIRAMLGWTPKTSLQEGLRLTLDFYRRNRNRYWDCAG